MLIFILWMAIGMIGELVLGIYAGIKSAKIEDECELDEHTLDREYNKAIIYAALDVIPFASLAYSFMDKGSKLWIPFAIFNNVCGYFLWPVLLPKMYANINDTTTKLHEYIDYKREREGS